MREHFSKVVNATDGFVRTASEDGRALRELMLAKHPVAAKKPAARTLHGTKQLAAPSHPPHAASLIALP